MEKLKKKSILRLIYFLNQLKKKLEKIGGTFQISRKKDITMSASPQSNDLRNRILFTIFILAIYRLGTFVPLPGIDPQQLQI